MNDFDNFFEAMKKKFEKKKASHGESWRKVSLISLRHRVREEYEEWYTATNEQVEMEKLINLASQCMLLWIRLREKYNILKTLRA